ncbi:hypothetical protein DWY79_06730 [Parabacteroides sp. AF27-14]|nr:hypothetical protein DWY79_06730 [Parabacteroides sp. AF27-14]
MACRYFSLERKVTKSSRLNRTGYSETYARCRIPTRFAQTGTLLPLASVSPLYARPLRPDVEPSGSVRRSHIPLFCKYYIMYMICAHVLKCKEGCEE